MSNKKIIIEAGYSNKGIKQAKNTLEKKKGDYGLVVSDSGLDIKGQIVKVPFRYFLVM